ncbi:hypothetical protein OOZ19_04425 [Saccharopolyspora sp. NFXS83]|uniref:putative T7SS-secreted protein n=1 Tax=Saccharopolyspora sp. NFXS83 TaxID=2993560 RepID=UPI00224B4C85|nr:hypothetical protein [Saccharopolyspora sp. NFXS83]MCX2729473.1 hypothetical protein [Saccharopolyspora sp. NFXS83]
MAAELGRTRDPKMLIPGDLDGILGTASSMASYIEVLHEAGEGLKRIDTTEGWRGEAAEQFRSAFDGEPGRWLEAGDCFHDAATALERYAEALTWSQGQAAEAIRLWDEGEAATKSAKAEHEQAPDDTPPQPFHDPGEEKRRAATALLQHARTELRNAGDVAADAVGRARDQAPEQPNFVEQAGAASGDAAGTVVNGLASLGNAAIHHPEMVLGLAGGAALTAVSAAGETAGVVLDATGAGAVAGVPLNAVSTAGIATGVGMMGVAMAGLASEAAGDDEVQPVDTDGAEAAPAEEAPAKPPEEITGMTKHGEERAMGRDGHGVSDQAMKDAVENPVKSVKEQAGGKYKYTGEDATVILGSDGQVITTWARNSNGWRHP